MEALHRPVPGFVGYSVTDHGEVWSWWKKRGGRKKATIASSPQHRLSPGIAGSHGYEQVWLYRDGERQGRFVHLLVLRVFVGPQPPGTQARHRNGNQRDNNVGNLAWGTPTENAADRDEHGRTCRGEAVASAVLDSDDVRLIRAAVAAGETHRAVGLRYGCSRRQVSRIVRREAWAHVA